MKIWDKNMKIDYPVPFYENTPDNAHCFQAALRMILKYFQPEKDFSWKDLDKITAKKEGLYTWQTAGMLWLQRNGFEVINMENFDNEKFIEMGGLYLIERLGEEVGRNQIEHSDIEQEIGLVRELVKKIKNVNKIPGIGDIKKMLEDKYLVICNVNSRKLNNRNGYNGHFVLVKGFNEEGFIIHDPGLPGLENRKVGYNLFEKAWAYPNEEARNIVAFKLK